jgi:hypothetical protein
MRASCFMQQRKRLGVLWWKTESTRGQHPKPPLSPPNPQPASDPKHSQAGFWRLLLVREGRDQSFVPLPKAAAPTSAADGSAAAAAAAAAAGGEGAAGGGLLTGCKIADVPLERWAVRAPGAGADGRGFAPEEVSN